MYESNQAARIICSNEVLADQLRPLLANIAPDCEVLVVPSDCSAAPFVAG